jgi:hypothetical protein
MMKYYTYTFSKPDGSVFYVGKGSGYRAFSSSDRPKYFFNIASEVGGMNIKIVKRFETEDEAFAHEKELIQHYLNEGVFLINRTKGGRGVTGFVQSEALRNHKRSLMKGYQYKKVQCPHCGFVGGATSTKRWHFDRCTGLKGTFKARATISGKRVWLGKFHTKDEANQAVRLFYIQHAVLPENSTWVVT